MVQRLYPNAAAALDGLLSDSMISSYVGEDGENHPSQVEQADLANRDDVLSP